MNTCTQRPREPIAPDSPNDTALSATYTIATYPYTTSSTVVVWNNWIVPSPSSFSVTTTSTVSSSVWDIWNQDPWDRERMPPPPRVPPDPQQQARIEAFARQAEIDARERRDAKDRAEKLLMTCLTPKQQEEFRTKGHFLCRSNTGRTYRIERRRSGNVREIEPASGRVLRTFCAHPREMVPDEDTMLAQKLLLETDEASFVRIANVTHH